MTLPLNGLPSRARESITTSEAVVFDRLIRPPVRDWIGHFEPQNHLLNTLLVKRSVALFRLSEFSFRLPALLGGAFYLWAVFRLARRAFGSGLLFVATVAVLALNRLVADDLSIGLAFWAWTLEFLHLRKLNLAGLCLGLSVASHLAFAVPAAALIVIALLAGWVVIERFVVTTVVTAVVLLAIPLSRADAAGLRDGGLGLEGWYGWAPVAAIAVIGMASRRIGIAALAVAGLIVGVAVREFPLGAYRGHEDEAGGRALVQVLRRESAGKHVRIGASAAAAPLVTFYRARYRMANWVTVRPLPLSENCDYYVLVTNDAGMVAERRLRVLYQDSGLTLAH